MIEVMALSTLNSIWTALVTIVLNYSSFVIVGV
jgi:hypothetical protein